jgi:hypothetical protein
VVEELILVAQDQLEDQVVALVTTEQEINLEELAQQAKAMQVAQVLFRAAQIVLEAVVVVPEPQVKPRSLVLLPAMAELEYKVQLLELQLTMLAEVADQDI